MGKSAGKAPDYAGAAQQQAGASQANVNTQTQQNRPNINTPFATQTWTTGPDGTPQLSTGLAGGLGAGASALESQFGEANAQPMDPSLFGGVQGGDAARDQTITGAYNQAKSRLDPQFAQQGQSLQAQLAAQGLDPNSEAARNAMGNFSRQENDAYGSAMNSAIGQGTQAGQAIFGQNLQAHQQALSDALAQRSAPLQSLQALSGLGQSMPQFNQAGLAEAPQYLSAAMGLGNYNLANQQMINQGWGDALGALGGLMGGAGQFAKLSDARLKQNITRWAIEALPGVPFATWEWKGHPGVRVGGVIAQDVLKAAPWCVLEGINDGLLRVDYRFLGAA